MWGFLITELKNQNGYNTIFSSFNIVSLKLKPQEKRLFLYYLYLYLRKIYMF